MTNLSDTANLTARPMLCSLEPDYFQVPTPQEIEDLTAAILRDAETDQMPPSKFRQLVERIIGFRNQWTAVFSRFEHHHHGELAYRDLLVGFEEEIVPLVDPWLSPSGKGKKAMQTLHSLMAVSPVSNPLNQRLQTAKKMLSVRARWNRTTSDATEADAAAYRLPEFEHPIAIVSAPRAGSTLLFETLSQFEDLWTIAEESHEIVEGIPELHPANRAFSSNRLTEVDAHPLVTLTLRHQFTRQLCDRAGRQYLHLPVQDRPQRVRFLEKTPKNALRIPFLKTIFPGIKFIYLYRDPRENISSLMEGWRSRRFITYKQLPGWSHREWSFFLPPGWSSLKESSLVEIAAYQWKIANLFILNDLKTLPTSSWHLVRYSDLIREPKSMLRQIAQFAELTWTEQIEQFLSHSLPISRLTLSPPSSDKWRKNEQEIAIVLPTLEPIVRILESNNLCLEELQSQNIIDLL